MAFGFLKDIGNIVQGGAGIASLFGGKDEPEASQQSSSALNEAIKLAKASADPKSKSFRNLVRLEEEALRTAAVEQIRSFLKQNQRNIARGGTSGIVNSERRDESVMKSLASAFQDAQDRARLNARTTLQNAAGSLTGAGAGLQPLADIQYTVNQDETKRRADLGQALGKGLGDLGGILDQFTQKSPTPAPGSTQIELT